VTEDLETPIQQPTAEDSPGAAGLKPPAGTGGASVQERVVSIADERPEVAVGAAFAGGLVLALILKRIAR
jgi:hypothetical protein